MNPQMKYWLACRHSRIYEEFFTLNGRFNPKHPWHPPGHPLGLWRKMWEPSKRGVLHRCVRTS